MFNTSVVGVQKKCTWARSPRFVVCVGGSTPLASIIFLLAWSSSRLFRRRSGDIYDDDDDVSLPIKTFDDDDTRARVSSMRSLLFGFWSKRDVNDVNDDERGLCCHEEQRRRKKKRDDFPTTLLSLSVFESRRLFENLFSSSLKRARVVYVYI